jgi:DNA-directed RNA polymerase subunit alpha
VKIKGAQHEFSTIPGVLEDTILLMLNLKQLRFKIYADEPQKAKLSVKGEREVRGSDITLPPHVEILNKSAHIATLTAKSAELEMELVIEKGLGYQSREARKKPREKPEIGVICLDAIFTPVRKVAFKIENMRVGERTDFDRLFLEIETDGTISPEEAFSKSAEILVNHFASFSQTFKKEEEAVPKASLREKPKKKSKRKPVAKKKK